MEIALNQNNAYFDLKLKNTIDMFKLSKIEKMLSDALENMPDESPINYIGDLNRSDIMQ